MAKRINNILKGSPPAKVNPDLFVEKEERDLHSTLVHRPRQRRAHDRPGRFRPGPGHRLQAPAGPEHLLRQGPGHGRGEEGPAEPPRAAAVHPPAAAPRSRTTRSSWWKGTEAAKPKAAR
ncbi:MAG: hypothetical protein MZU95_01960 [Desulfomicrobium escambiense]|nr:hypothetical protein [Desulfomicrobium escambiense]